MNALLDSIHSCMQSMKSLILPAYRVGTNASSHFYFNLICIKTSLTLIVLCYESTKAHASYVNFYEHVKIIIRRRKNPKSIRQTFLHVVARQIWNERYMYKLGNKKPKFPISPPWQPQKCPGNFYRDIQTLKITRNLTHL